MNHILRLVDEIEITPASSNSIISSFSETSPPAMTGVEDSLQMRLTTLGISAGRISIKSGREDLICLSIFSYAMESMTNRRRIVYKPNSLALFIKAGLVVIIPSASVYFLMKSTAISLEFSPLIRSICTMAIFPLDFTSETMSEILHKSPYNMKTTLLSLSLHFFSPSSSFIAAIIGESSKASKNSFFKLFHLI